MTRDIDVVMALDFTMATINGPNTIEKDGHCLTCHLLGTFREAD
jgi:hypothetical protein